MRDSDLQKLLKSIQDPGLRHAEESIHNTVKMRGLGQDDPIEWEAFGRFPGERQSQRPSALSHLLTIAAQKGFASGVPTAPEEDRDFLDWLLSLGMPSDGRVITPGGATGLLDE